VAWQRYRRALNNPFSAQTRLLSGYLRENADTVVGRTYGFSSIRSVEEYQARVPLSTFDSIEPLVQRVARGETNILTRQRVHRLVPSSGSTAAVKLVPYTQLLQREISRAVDAWIADVYRHDPRLLLGPAYWSITPAAAQSRPFVRDTPGGNTDSKPRPGAIPVGFDDDGSYLGGLRAVLARAVMAVPPTLRLGNDLTEFQRTTLRHLLLTRDLRLISVWHPSLLSTLLDAMVRDWTLLVNDVSGVDRRRGSELRRIDPNDVVKIWPQLRLISCWSDGPARAHASALAGRTAGIALQPKGLLATEGVVTIPFGGRHPLAVRSHFFEFLTPSGRPVFAHQLELGIEYSVILTTGGGLYRYHLADRVIVDGFVERTPSLRFVGKDDRVSDRCGEKLSDGFVAGVLDKVFAAPRVRPRFAMLAPEEWSTGTCYTLFVERTTMQPPDLDVVLETALRANPHYAWCVDVGQLGPARVVHVGPGADRAYVDFCMARGQRLGDIKPTSLHPATGWKNVLPC
jgi:hypothetical protein